MRHNSFARGHAILLTLTTATLACAKSEAGDPSASKITSALEDKAQAFPATLTDTALFLDAQGKTPVSALVPYEVKVPLWSDGAHKKRFIFVPPGQKIAVDPTSHELSFPVGTTLVKYFAGATATDSPVETRVITKKTDGLWHFATYVWDSSKGRAEFNKNPRKIAGPDADYRIPSESECKTCHGNGQKLVGFRLEQLNFVSSLDKDGRNQLQRLSELVSFDASPATLMSAVAYDNPNDTSLALKARARSYMNVNCGTCHNPDGPDVANKMDFRLAADDTHLVSTGNLISGDRANSILWKKISADTDRMPPLTLRADPVALDLLGKLIDQWATP